MLHLHCLLIIQGLLLISSTGAQDEGTLEITTENPLKLDGGQLGTTMCEARGLSSEENPGLKWLYDNGTQIALGMGAPIAVMPEGTTKLRLTFSSAKEYMAGDYKCQGTINGQTKTVTLTVDIRMPLEISEKDCPTAQSATKGTNAVIKCVIGADFEVKWFSPLNVTFPIPADHQRYTQSQQGLEITDVQEIDEGTFTSFITSKTDPARVAINYIRMTVYIKPVFSLKPGDHKVETGSEARMSCLASGKPTPLYSWYKGNDPLPLAGDRYVIEATTGVFVIKKVILDDKGVYKCKATNKAGNVTAQAELIVIVPPEIRQFDNETADEGTSATLSCRAYGDPMPKIEFKKDGIVVTDAEKMSTGDSTTDPERMEITSRLTVNTLAPADNGFFTCEATNEAATMATQKAYLTVRYKPTFDLKKSNTSAYTWEGNPGRLTCVTNGVPIPMVKWRKGNDSNYLTSAEFFKITDLQTGPTEKTSTLEVIVDYSNSQDLFDKYTCESKNDIGTSTHVITLKRADRPAKPGVTQLPDSPTPRTVSFRITVNKVINGPDPTNVRITWHLKNNAGLRNEIKTIPINFLDNENQKTLEVDDIDNLEPKTQYTFEIVAVSTIGDSNINEMDIETPAKRQPYEIRYFSRPQCSSDLTCRVQWQKPKNGGDPIVSYTVEYRQVSVHEDKDPVTNEWRFKDFLSAWDKSLKPLSGQATSTVLQKLKPLSFYEVRISATNMFGTAAPNSIIVKTEKGQMLSQAPEEGGLPLGVIVAIIIIAFLVLFVIVDVTCYYTRKCGVLKCIKDKLDGEASSDTTRIKEAEEGDGENKEPLLQDGKVEESAQEEEGTPKEELKEMEPEDKEEKIDKPPTPENKDVEVADEAKPEEPLKPASDDTKEGAPTDDAKKEQEKDGK